MLGEQENHRIGIVGLGLIGGSLLKALRRAGMGAQDIVVVDTDATTLQAIDESGLADTAARTVDESLASCGLLVLCLPLPAVEEALKRVAALRPMARGQRIVSDVTGIKAPVLALAKRHLEGARFVGAHPMIGGVHAGFQHSRDDLFEGATVAVCREAAESDPAPTRAVQNVWESVGASVVTMTATQHDAQVAHTSHLPYLASIAQILSFAEHGLGSDLVGRSFADVTRRAAFAPELMATIAASNPALKRAVVDLAGQLLAIGDLLPDKSLAGGDANKLVELAEKARRLRAQLVAD